MPWVKNGKLAGSENSGWRIEGIQVLVKSLGTVMKNPETVKPPVGRDPMETNAMIIYQTLSVYGLSDAMIAGLLSNFETECNIDPTGIEAIFESPYAMNGAKVPMRGNDLAAEKALSDWTKGPMYDAYARSGIALAWDFYGPGGSNGYYYGGVGIASWTGYAQVHDLFQKSQVVNKHWWDMDYQIAYLLHDPSMTPNFWSRFKQECKGKNATECAYWFYYAYEMPGGRPAGWDALHAKHADKWMSMIRTWPKNAAYGNSIISLANKIQATRK